MDAIGNAFGIFEKKFFFFGILGFVSLKQQYAMKIIKNIQTNGNKVSKNYKLLIYTC